MTKPLVTVAIAAVALGSWIPTTAFADRVWSITPYVWATHTTYDLKADGSPVDAGTVDFGELYDSLDAAFQVVVETGNRDGRWSVFTDLTYIKTSERESISVPGAGRIRVDAESEQLWLDVAVAFWPWGEPGGFNVFGGIRYVDLDDETTFDLRDPVTTRLGKSRLNREFTDALVGVRHRFDLSERWSLHVHADYAAGDSEGIFQGHALLRFAVGKSKENGLMLGYRYKEAEFDDSGLEEEYKYKGPLVGYNVRF